MTAAPTKAGFIAVVGAPNVGKSTLVNRLVGTKVTIVSPKVQTTRIRVLGICMAGRTQLVFIDTHLTTYSYHGDDALAGQGVAPVHRNIQNAGHLGDLHQCHPCPPYRVPTTKKPPPRKHRSPIWFLLPSRRWLVRRPREPSGSALMRPWPEMSTSTARSAGALKHHQWRIRGLDVPLLHGHLK